MKKTIKNSEIFNTLFGITQEKIKETCVIIPFYSKHIMDELKIKTLSNGLLHSCCSNESFSLIITRMGAGFVGDAVLHLKDTGCKNLIFLGSCGAWNKSLKIGDLVLVEKAYSQDSFVNMLLKRELQDVFYPAKKLDGGLLPSVLRGNCLSVASLKLEEEYIQRINDKNIDVVDMETAAFLAAANSIKRPALSLLYVTDILGSNPYYSTFKKENREVVASVSRNAAKKLSEILYAK